MARVLTPQDAHAIVNALVAQITGQDGFQAINTSDFVSTGEFLLSQGVENVFNKLSILLNRTIIAARPYEAKLNIIQAVDEGEYNSRLRKISYYSKFAKEAGDYNTDMFTNFANGFTAGQNIDDTAVPQSTKSQWEQNPPIPFERNFGGVSVWQDCITQYEEAVRYAFTSEEEFARFVSGYLTEHANDIESQKEAWNRLAIVQHIAATFIGNHRDACIDLTAAYNDRYGTSYTRQELLSEHLSEFLAFFVATFKNVSDFMRERSTNFHWDGEYTDDNGDKYHILRHTPYRDQRVILYSPLFREAEAMVLPEIFHDKRLNIETQYEGVNYWQSLDDRPAISAIPAITNDSGVQVAGDLVQIPYVVGMIFDRDALMTSFRLDRTRTTPVEARKGYFNTWYSIARNIISDPTENTVIFYMSDDER